MREYEGFSDGKAYTLQLTFSSPVWMGLENSIYRFPFQFKEAADGAIRGTVTDAHGAPVQGASISLSSDPSRTAITDANGEYAFDSVSSGTYSVTCSAAGYTTQTKRTAVDPGETARVDFTLDPVYGSLIGTVVDGLTGDPIEGAAIAPIDGDGSPLVEKTSGEDGTFGYEQIPSGTYTGTVRAEGYEDNDSEVIAVAADGSTTSIVIKLWPRTITLTGTVTDKDNGSPIGGASVSVSATVSLPNGQSPTATTDASGVYSFSVYAADYHATVAASAAGYSDDSADVPIMKSSSSPVVQDLELSRSFATVTFETYLRDAATPFENRTLIVTETATNDEQPVATDGNGRVSVNLSLGAYTVRPADDKGYDIEFDSPIALTTTDHVASFSLDTPGLSAGAIAITFKPIEVAVRVVVSGEGAQTFELGDVQTYLQGTSEHDAQDFNLQTSNTTSAGNPVSTSFAEKVPFGTYTVSAEAAGYATAWDTVEIGSGDPEIHGTGDDRYVEIELHLLKEYAELTGRVLYSGSGEPVAGATVSMAYGEEVLSRTTNDQGETGTARVAPGTYEGTASYGSYTAPAQTVTVADAERRDVLFYVYPKGSIAGLVRDYVARTPIDNATITVSGSPTSDPEVYYGNHSNPPLGDGQYHTSSLQDGTYTVEVQAPGYHGQTRTVTVSNGRVSYENFHLMPLLGILSGSVEYADGSPVPGARMSVRAADASESEQEATTDADGAYSFTPIHEGEYIVTMETSLAVREIGTIVQTEDAHIVADENTVVYFVIPLPGSLEGTVSTADGTPIAQASVTVYSNTSSLTYTTTTDAQGRYLFAGLPVGDYTVVTAKDGYATQAKQTIIEADATSIVDFVLDDRPGFLEGTVTVKQTGDPVSGATITITPGSIKVVTDENGAYRIPLVAGSYDVSFEYNDTLETRSTTIEARRTTTEDFVIDLDNEEGQGEEGDDGAAGSDGDAAAGSGSNAEQGTRPAASRLSPTGDSALVSGLAFALGASGLALVIGVARRRRALNR